MCGRGAGDAAATKIELPTPKVTLGDTNNHKRVLDEFTVKVSD
jgi:hypothetical protein